MVKAVKLVLTDCDGVLTDSGVYYSDAGEVMKRFSIRDGMGVQRLRSYGIETGIVTGESSGSVKKRAEKLGIEELHLGAKVKADVLKEIVQRRGLSLDEIAYIGDDVNDLEVLAMAGVTACPADAVYEVREQVDYVCQAKGGHGAFREFAEWILSRRTTDGTTENQSR